MSHRLAQINELLQREISLMLRTEIEVPTDLLVTIIAVDTSADLQNAVVWVSVLPDTAEQRAMRFLSRHAKALHVALFRSVRFRPVPVLHFRHDSTEAKAAEVEKLLDQLPR